MNPLERRLKKLEIHMTDPSGLVSHSPKWREYWLQQIASYMSGMSGQWEGPRPLFPLDALREFMQNAPPDGYA